MKATDKQILKAVKLIDEEKETFSCLALEKTSHWSASDDYSVFFNKRSKSTWFSVNCNNKSKNERMTALLLYMVAREDVLGG